MGLDMYAASVAPNEIPEGQEIDFELSEDAHKDEIKYWRKHHDLHGFMEKLYAQKGGKQEFNCVNLRLREADLDELERTIKSKVLPPTTGFFFGNSPPDDESDAEDLEFVAQCRVQIADGCAVVYSAWY